MAQIRNHPNPPQITFPKKVGNSEVKAEITDMMTRVLQVLAPNMDFSEYTLPVVLTRASRSTQSADGTVGAHLQKLTVNKYETDLDRVEMNLKIAKTDGTRDNAGFDSLEMVIAHEMVHYVQFMTKCLYTTAEVFGRRVTYFTHWNASQAKNIQNNVMMAVSGMDFGVEYMPLLEAYLGCDKTRTSKRRTDYEAYLAQPHETQAFRLTPLIMNACGWYSADAVRKAGEARKASMKRLYPQAYRAARNNPLPKRTMQELNELAREKRRAAYRASR